MNGKQARKLRKKIFLDSTEPSKEYIKDVKSKTVAVKDGKAVRVNVESRKLKGLYADYKELKKFQNKKPSTLK